MSAVVSTGLPMLAKSGSSAARAACVAGASPAIGRRAAPARSAASAAVPPENDVDAQPVAALGRGARQQLRYGQELVQVVDLDGAELPEHRAIDGGRARHRGGMRLGRAHAGLGAADLQHHHGLAALARQLQGGGQAAAVLHAFHQQRDHADPGIGRHVGDEIGNLQVDLVAGGEPQPHAVAMGQALQQVAAQPSALRGQADAAAVQVVLEGGREGHADAVAHVHEAGAVRSVDVQAGVAAQLCDLAFQAPAFFAGFEKPEVMTTA